MTCTYLILFVFNMGFLKEFIFDSEHYIIPSIQIFIVDMKEYRLHQKQRSGSYPYFYTVSREIKYLD